MPRMTANPEPTASDYRRAMELGEAAGDAKGLRWVSPDAQPNQPSKETIMFRNFVTIAFLALTATAAQADTTADRIQQAAQNACQVERAAGSLPASHYDAIYRQCVWRLSHQAMDRVQEARAKAARKVAGN